MYDFRKSLIDGNLRKELKRAHYLFVAIDRATRWVFVAIKKNKAAANAKSFLKAVYKACPFKISKLLTDNVLNAIGLSKNGNSIPCRSARTNRHRIKSNEQVLQQSSASIGAPVNHSGNKIPGCDQPDLYRT